MARNCLECGKKKGIFSHNYAGFDVRQAGSHPFVDWIEPLILPGSKDKEYLCVECANKRTVSCRHHGKLKSRIKHGLAPSCQICVKNADVFRTPLEWRNWGQLRWLPCPFCGNEHERATRSAVVSIDGGDVMSAMADLAARNQVLSEPRPIEQSCWLCKTKFESRLAPGGAGLHQWRPGPAYL